MQPPCPHDDAGRQREQQRDLTKAGARGSRSALRSRHGTKENALPVAPPETRKPGRPFRPHHAHRHAKAGGPSPRPAAEDSVVLYGWHPVSEALANERRGLRRLLASEN